MRQDLPVGVVTLLFTDIEGSTRLLSELRSGYVDALAEHRRLIRQAAAAHGGVEVDAQGDSILIAFRRGALHALGAVAGAMARNGDPEGLRLMRAIVVDEDMPGFLATQVQAEIGVAEARFGEITDGEPVDLDATVKRLLERSHPAPVLR